MKIKLINFFNKNFNNKNNNESDLLLLKEKIEKLNQKTNQNINFYFFLSKQIPEKIEIDLNELEKIISQILEILYSKMKNGDIFIKIQSNYIIGNNIELNIIINYNNESDISDLNINIENDDKYIVNSIIGEKKGKINITFKTNILKKNHYFYKNDNLTSIILISDNEIFNSFFLSILEELKFNYYIFDSFLEYKEFEEEIFENKKIFILEKLLKNYSSKEEFITISNKEFRIKSFKQEINIENLVNLLNLKVEYKNYKNTKYTNEELNVDLKYYKIFFSTIGEEIKLLEKFYKIKDFESIKKLSHKLKSGAKILKESNLIETFQTLEDKSKLNKNIKFDIQRLKKIINEIEKTKLNYYL